jgi:UPF0271 protein
VSRASIDLNADLGEDPAALAAGLDAALLDLVTSANIACGGHAGDDATMRAVVRLANERGVAVGAHPSFPDRVGFGRRDPGLGTAAIEETVHAQAARLQEIAREEGVPLRHLKPHGALYHAAMERLDVADAIARAAARLDRGLVLVGLARAPALDRWRAAGFRTAAEGFADRTYEADGTLRPRERPGALLLDPPAAARQAVALARSGSVDTICLHGDMPGAVAIALAVRDALAGAGFRLAPPT